MDTVPKAFSLAFRPWEVRWIIQWKLFHTPVHRRTAVNKTTTEATCLRLLELTSRSFTMVIKELHPELLLPVCVFYLVLRGLDTIEDDPSIPLPTKEPLLRKFEDYIEQDGWTYSGIHPQEKDRELLVQFDAVVAEFMRMKPAYRAVVREITRKMGNGMADFSCKVNNLGTVADYDLYCYYVAGLVGEGLSQLFVASALGSPGLLRKPNLHKSMGLFLQKTNIIRDVHEDHFNGRYFWPREIWSKHVDSFDELFKVEYRQQALECSSEMILNALAHVQDCLVYLSCLTEQSVFNFCAIPQAMAIATLELCFGNPAIFERNVKISKGKTCRLMLQSTGDLHNISAVFRVHVERIRDKCTPSDKHFVEIRTACDTIVKFIEMTFDSHDIDEVAPCTKGKFEAESFNSAGWAILIVIASMLYLFFSLVEV
ncbi:isoprenoid synthase domain-containing protein [Aspergillus granulosus]|uniref:Squalene synthase n=1 Tax=Aspergillus granulosus TaxID=176169 RepID=A0ABR4H413_9EURO